MPWDILFNALVMGLEWWLRYTKQKQETYDAFLKFIDKIDKERSRKLRQSYYDQLDRLEIRNKPKDQE